MTTRKTRTTSRSLEGRKRRGEEAAAPPRSNSQTTGTQDPTRDCKKLHLDKTVFPPLQSPLVPRAVTARWQVQLVQQVRQVRWYTAGKVVQVGAVRPPTLCTSKVLGGF